MSWIILPEPGSKHGPCKSACKHLDCKATREQAASLCPLCGEPLGYNTQITMDDKKQQVHFGCLLHKAEREEQARKMGNLLLEAEAETRRQNTDMLLKIKGAYALLPKSKLEHVIHSWRDDVTREPVLVSVSRPMGEPPERLFSYSGNIHANAHRAEQYMKALDFLLNEALPWLLEKVSPDKVK